MELNEEIRNEANQWTLVFAYTRTCFDRYTDEVNYTRTEENRRKARESEFVIEDGKLIGFDLRGGYSIEDYKDILRIPDGKIERSDSYSSYDWEENVCESTIVTLEKDLS